MSNQYTTNVQPILYKVETYIMPQFNKYPARTSDNTEIDDIKIANQTIGRLKIDDDASEGDAQDEEDASSFARDKCAESMERPEAPRIYRSSINVQLGNAMERRGCCTSDGRSSVSANMKRHNDEEVFHRFDDELLDAGEMKFQGLIRPQMLYPARQFKRINSLMSIDERSEGSESRLNDLCHHGYRNGCTAIIPPPEEISEEVFKENWLQKIEILRQREAVVTAKETSLQNRERELFRREREIRIQERILKDKLRQVEQQQKRQKDMWVVQKRLQEVGRILESTEYKEAEEQMDELENAPPAPPPPSIVESLQRTIKEPDKRARSLSRSRSCRSSKQSSSCNVASGLHSYSSIRYKERPKISYEDLNSTLSADAGDASFVRTSERFNPALYQKPYVFTRSASERCTKQQDSTIAAKVQSSTTNIVETSSQRVIEEEKVLRKLSENISATQDKDTRFQHYGPVDVISEDNRAKAIECNAGGNTMCNVVDKGRFSYLDLETGNKFRRQKLAVGASKDRPITWNEETNEWLQKKRQAYNIAAKKVENSENKENKCNIVTQKGKSAKKDVKRNIFSLFR